MNHFFTGLRRSVILGVVASLTACTVFHRRPTETVRPTKESSLVEVTPPDLQDDLKPESLVQALDGSIAYYGRLKPDTRFTFDGATYTASYLKASLEDFRRHLVMLGLSDEFFEYVRNNFRFYRTTASDTLFTGYYEATLRGSTRKNGRCKFPIYRTPRDLLTVNLQEFFPNQSIEGGINRARVEGNTVHPYYSREEIDYREKLKGKGLEIGWVEDPIELFFLHIQGSGRLYLDDGKVLHLGFAEKNGYGYKAIGKLLLDRGVLTKEDTSMQAIRAYLKAHPKEMRTIFDYNPSYVFFKVMDKGPLGSIGVKLEPYRSIATDSKLFPKGALGFIETEVPLLDEQGRVVGTRPVARFVLNQDTGGAIRGAGRVDLFTGAGEKSEEIAGHMKFPGTFYFLVRVLPFTKATTGKPFLG